MEPNNPAKARELYDKSNDSLSRNVDSNFRCFEAPLVKSYSLNS